MFFSNAKHTAWNSVPTYVLAVVKYADGFSGAPLISLVLGRTDSGSTFRWHFSHLLLQREEIQKKMTEMPSKRRSGICPSQDRTDTQDTRETISIYILDPGSLQTSRIFFYVNLDVITIFLQKNDKGENAMSVTDLDNFNSVHSPVGMQAKGIWKQDPEMNIWVLETCEWEWRRLYNEELDSL